jgi:hypothetical protein
MGLLTCCGSRWKTLSRAAAKSAASTLRRAGGLSIHPHWSTRAEICERCPMRVLRRGITYCGDPLLEKIDRHPQEGCGCPTLAKAKSPSEHCPLTLHYTPADTHICNCKWCSP